MLWVIFNSFAAVDAHHRFLTHPDAKKADTLLSANNSLQGQIKSRKIILLLYYKVLMYCRLFNSATSEKVTNTQKATCDQKIPHLLNNICVSPGE